MILRKQKHSEGACEGKSKRVGLPLTERSAFQVEPRPGDVVSQVRLRNTRRILRVERDHGARNARKDEVEPDGARRRCHSSSSEILVVAGCCG